LEQRGDLAVETADEPHTHMGMQPHTTVLEVLETDGRIGGDDGALFGPVAEQATRVGGEPRSEGDAGGAIEVELSAARIEGKPRLEPKLARRGHEARTQTPHDALAMEPPRVQPHLAAMIGIDRL